MLWSEDILWGKELQIRFFKKYGNTKKRGLKEFVDIINFENSDMKENLLNLIDDETELIWYPGCGGDVSPCSVLERKNFEKNNSIVTSGKRMYIFTDPDQYNTMCGNAFGGQHKIYDCSVEDYSKKYKIDKCCEINIVDDLGETIIAGYYDILSLGDKTCNIIYLRMTMQDYLLLCVKLFELNIKWLFYLKMESKGGNLFDLYEKCDIPYPEWICANRIEKFTKISELATLKPMRMKDGTSCYIDEDKYNGCADVMFGMVHKNGRKGC